MRITLVVPVFNEQATIAIFYAAVRAQLPYTAAEVEILFVDDGSEDGTVDAVHQIMALDPFIRLIRLSRNFGKEAALFAGLDHADGDAVIPIDVDLQDPIDVIPRLVEKWRAGADVVLAKRVDRLADSRMKRHAAASFYKLHNLISSPKLNEDVGDFRLLDRRIVEIIRTLPERNLFMKGILSWVGGDVAVVEYTRAARSSGHTKFNGWKLWNLALEGLTSFSTFPLRVWTYLGLSIAGLSFLYGAAMLIDKMVFGNAVPGYPSLLAAVLFLGGVQLIGIGVLGEYIGRIYIESKHRPRYVVKSGRNSN